MSDAQLLEKIKADPSAFSELFALYYRPIFGYIVRRTGDFDDAADIAAETFTRAFTHIGRFSYRGIPIKVWLYRIATNELNMYFRNRRRERALVDTFDPANRAQIEASLQDDRKEMEEELRKHGQFLTVLRQLKTLPLKYQEVIALRYFEGKENREIAEILDLKEGTLKSLLSRGVKKLQEKCTAQVSRNPGHARTSDILY